MRTSRDYHPTLKKKENAEAEQAEQQQLRVC